MRDSLLSKYARQPTEVGIAESDALDPDGTEDLGCFGFLRGVRDRAVMLELKKKDGTVAVIAYAFVERVTYHPDGPSEGITIHGAGKQIRITGRNLNSESKESPRLLGVLARHRVPWMREADRPTLVMADDALTVIDSIEW